jgi:hypothetical protein
MGSIRVGAQRLDKARLGRRQQLRQHGEVTAANRSELERGMYVDLNYAPARREPQVALAGEQDLPCLVLLMANQGMLSIGAEPAVGSRLASGAGQAVISARSAVFGPSTWPEMPAAEGLDPSCRVQQHLAQRELVEEALSDRTPSL